MLMMNAPQAGAPRPSNQPAAAPPPVAPAAPPAAAPAAAAPAPATAPVAPKPKLKGTMIGVAPPSLGSNAPPVVGGAPAPAPQIVQPPAPAYEPPPAPVAAPAPSMANPVSSVNPLGGTMVADTGGFGAGFPPAAPPAMGGGYDIGAPPPGFGAPAPGFGAPPPGFGGADALGATAPAADAQPMAMAPAYQPPQPAPMAPVAPAPMASYEDDEPIPGVQGGPNPIVTVLLIVLTFGLYGIYLLVKGKKSSN
jgi:hypothetical protein